MAARALRFLLALAFVALVGASPAAADVVRVAPVQDLSLPFGCDWSYDWEERCFVDDSSRLPLGGDLDKEWRAALRFSPESLPPAYAIQSARLRVYHDGTCTGPRRREQRCDGRPFTIDVHRILASDWFDEREVAFGESPLARATIPDGSASGWLTFDVSDLVVTWAEGESEAAGILLKLTGVEAWSSGGPALPSADWAVLTQRPWLEVTYLAASGRNVRGRAPP